MFEDLNRKLTAKFVCEHRWQVAYNGRIMGDDRGYNTEAECEREIDNRIRQDHSDAVRYNRPVYLSR